MLYLQLLKVEGKLIKTNSINITSAENLKNLSQFSQGIFFCAFEFILKLYIV